MISCYKHSGLLMNIKKNMTGTGIMQQTRKQHGRNCKAFLHMPLAIKMLYSHVAVIVVLFSKFPLY